MMSRKNEHDFNITRDFLPPDTSPATLIMLNLSPLNQNWMHFKCPPQHNVHTSRPLKGKKTLNMQFQMCGMFDCS